MVGDFFPDIRAHRLLFTELCERVKTLPGPEPSPQVPVSHLLSSARPQFQPNTYSLWSPKLFWVIGQADE